jgi:hypothetical protein
VLSIVHPERLVLPHLRIEGPRSFVLAVNGGLGDICVAVEAVLELRRRLDPHGRIHEWICAVATPWFRAIKPLLEEFGVFTRIVDLADAASLPRAAKHPTKLLRALLAGTDVDARLARGSTIDHLWSTWGAPGRFSAARSPRPIQTCRRALAAHYSELAERCNLPRARRFVLLAPEATYLGGLKSWPVASWRELLATLDRELDVVICASLDVFHAIDDGRCRPFDFTNAALANDLRNFASVVASARAIVSLDSGPAHLASLLRAPCVSLWGPTSPAIYASPNSLVLRASLCPPCSADARAKACPANVCMQAIEPASVAAVVSRLASVG